MRPDALRAYQFARAMLAAAREAGRTTALRAGRERVAADYYAEHLGEQLGGVLPGMRDALADAFVAGARERRSGMVEA